MDARTACELRAVLMWQGARDQSRYAQPAIRPRGMSTSRHATRALTQRSLAQFLDDVQLEFNSICNTAPFLPQPVPPGYKQIRLMAMVESARACAPLKPLVEVKSVHERRVQRLASFYVWTCELGHCHERLAARNALLSKLLQLASLVATNVTSVLLFAWPGDDTTLVVCGIVVTIVGGLNAWAQYAGYQNKADRHRATADSFSQLSAAIESALIPVSEEVATTLRQSVAHLDALTSTPQRVIALSTRISTMRRVIRTVSIDGERMIGGAAGAAQSKTPPFGCLSMFRRMIGGAAGAAQSKTPPSGCLSMSEIQVRKQAETCTEAIQGASRYSQGPTCVAATAAGAYSQTLPSLSAEAVLTAGMRAAGSKCACVCATPDMPVAQTGEEANLALQLILRTSLERRYAHDWAQSRLRRADDMLQIIGLVGSTVAYLCLFLSAGNDLGGEGDGGGVNSVLRHVGEAVTIALTLLGYLRAACALDAQAARHAHARSRFASLARDAAMLLAIDTREEQLDEVPKLQRRFDELQPPLLPPASFLRRFEAEKGLPLFPVLSGTLTASARPTVAAPAPARPAEQASRTGPGATLDKAARRQLLDLHLDGKVRAIGSRFNAAFESMPDVHEESLPKQFGAISRAASLREAHNLAPLTHATNPAPSEARRLLNRTVKLYARALNLQYAHQRFARKHKRRLSQFQMATILGAALISIALLVTPDDAEQTVGVVSSVLAAGLSLAAAWQRFARHDQLHADHTVAMQDFADLAFEMERVFAILGDLADAHGDANLPRLLDWAAEQDHDEDPARSAAAAPALPSATAGGSAEQQPTRRHYRRKRRDPAASHSLPPSPPPSPPGASEAPTGRRPSPSLTVAQVMAGLAPTPPFEARAGRRHPELSLETKLQHWCSSKLRRALPPHPSPLPVGAQPRPRRFLWLGGCRARGTSNATRRGRGAQESTPAHDVDLVPHFARLRYRKAAEYRIVHLLVSARAGRLAALSQFAMLALTTIAAALLAFGQPFPLVAAVIAASVTGLAGLVRFQDFDLKYQQHAASAGQWADVEGKLATLLTACTEAQQHARFPDAADRFNAAMTRQPLLPPMGHFKDEQGRPLFQAITEGAINQEKADNLAAIKKLLDDAAAP